MKRKIFSIPDLEPFFFNELEIIDRSKGIIDTKQITKQKLLDEYKVITEAYKELL
jgi:hypothetical protein